MTKWLIIFIALLIISPTAFAKSASVVIHQDTINDYLKAVGTIKGKGKHNGVKYTWSVKNAKVEISKGKATFKATAKVKASGISKSSKVKGVVDMIYDDKKNRIKMHVNKVIFNVYIELLGQKIKVATLDLAKYYKPKFEFAGPQPIQNKVEMDLPQGKRVINIQSYNHNLLLKEKQLVVQSDIRFTPVKDKK